MPISLWRGSLKKRSNMVPYLGLVADTKIPRLEIVVPTLSFLSSALESNQGEQRAFNGRQFSVKWLYRSAQGLCRPDSALARYHRRPVITVDGFLYYRSTRSQRQSCESNRASQSLSAPLLDTLSRYFSHPQVVLVRCQTRRSD